MLNRIQIENFQSLKSIDIELHPLTVIVGKSSSGKSAFARAIRTLASNRRGTDWIAHGENQSVITATTPTGVVSLTRSKSTAATANKYELQLPGQSPLLFTKLGGDVPPRVTEFLGISPKNAIQFASQFDKPYLLDESPAEAARIIGALTNIDTVMAGAREANRLRLQDSQILKVKRQELENIEARIPEFKKITEQSAALDRADELLATAYELQVRISKLSSAIEQIQIAADTVKRLKAQQITVPDISDAIARYQKLQELKSAITVVTSARDGYLTAKSSAEARAAELEQAHSALQGYRDEIGGDLASMMMPSAVDSMIEVQTAARISIEYFEK